MIKHKVFDLLNTFDRKEMSRFEAFVHSPYHNKHRGVRELVAYLSKIYPDFNSRNCSKDYIIKKSKLPQDTEYSQLALVFTYMIRLADQFLITEHYNNKTSYNQVMLLEELRQRKCFKTYRKNLDKYKRELAEVSEKDSHFFERSFQLAREADSYFILTDGRKKDPNLEVKIRQLDYFYMTEKLKDAVEVHNRKNILSVNYSNRMLEGVLSEISSNIREYQEVPGVFIYFLLYQMTSLEQDEFYFQAMDYMNRNEQFLSKVERIIIYNNFQNYCIKQINLNNLKFLAELFQLYQLQLEEELIFEDGYLSEWHYKNIVTTAIRLNETDWVKNFIYEYKEKLRPESIENAFRFNLASYYHATGEFGKVLELLLRLEYNDLRYNLGAKALLLRTYYEMEEFEALNSLSASFYQYLQRNKLMADTRKDAYHNLFRFTKRVAQLRSEIPYTSKEKVLNTLKKLKTDIGKTSIIFNQNWLESKVADLEERV